MARKGENIYKRKDGRWEGRYIKARSENGKAIYGYVYAEAFRSVSRHVKAVKSPGIPLFIGIPGLFSQSKILYDFIERTGLIICKKEGILLLFPVFNYLYLFVWIFSELIVL